MSIIVKFLFFIKTTVDLLAEIIVSKVKGTNPTTWIAFHFVLLKTVFNLKITVI